MEKKTKPDISVPAPDFAINDSNGKTITLSDYRNKKHIVLVFNRGFA